MNTIIDQNLSAIEKALRWAPNVPEAEQLQFKKELIDIRRELRKVKYAMEEHCSTAAFGESQMGKSYLVSAMLSKPGEAFCVTDSGTGERYNFINEINPSAPNATVEATGVVTRFTVNADGATPTGSVKIRLLSVVDVVLILCEAYYTQVVDYDFTQVLRTNTINDIIKSVSLGRTGENTLLSEDDVLDLQEYMRSLSIYNRSILNITDSDLFSFLVQNVSKLSDIQIIDLLSLFWDKNPDITRIFKDLIAEYRKLHLSTFVYIPFKSVLRKHGTILDVARLNEMYCAPDNVPIEYIGDSEVILPTGERLSVKKSFLSALTAELYLVLPNNVADEHPFLKHLDILDFPGARRPEKIKANMLADGENISTAYRRGKVTYLFNKYSNAKRINSLMFCHNNNQSAESTMSFVLNNWVSNNVGGSPDKRAAFISQSQISPLFIVSTWFNKDLVYHDEIKGKADLDERWRRRFSVVLEGEVLKSLSDESNSHWFNNWTTGSCFKNIYMLRDFKFSKEIYSGYHPGPEGRSPELSLISHPAYPNFLNDLRSSFCSNSFVKEHFEAPDNAWDCAANINCDGTARIINGLNTIAPNLNNARNAKFSADIKALQSQLKALLINYYHSDNKDEEVQKAKKQSRRANMQIDIQIGADPSFFGVFMDKLMLNETELRELLHGLLINNKGQVKMSSIESQVFIAAGLSTENSKQENERLLCEYTGSDDITECKEMLSEMNVDIAKLLSSKQMHVGTAESIVTSVEEYWYNEILSHYAVNALKDKVDSISNIAATLYRLYLHLNIRTRIIEKVDYYLKCFGNEGAVCVLSDYLSVMFNKMTSSFGYEYLDKSTRESIEEINEKFNLKINKHYIETTPSDGINLIGHISKQKEILERPCFGADDKEFLNKFPQYNSVWRWEEQLKIGFVLACDLPNYDAEANKELGQIISVLN